MFVYVVIITISIFIGGGIIWLLKKRFTKSPELEAVPISDISEIGGAEGKTDVISDKHNIKQNVNSIDNLKAEVLALRQKINHLSREYKQNLKGLEMENRQLKEAVKNEIALRDKTLDKDKSEVFRQMEQSLKEARQAIDTLSAENVRLRRQMESLSKERDDLFEQRSELMMDLKRIEEHNAQLLEKERFLQYELTKTRAKAMGLEKICEEFKIRLETTNR